LVLLAVATLAAFAVFAWRVPIFSALKSSYLLNLSLPYGFFVARCVAAIASRGAAWPRLLAPLAVLGAAGVTAAVFTPGLVLARRADNPRMAAVRAYFGDYDRAASVYRSALAVATGGSDRPIWLREALAAVELEAGRTASALGLYRSTFHLTVQESPHVERRGSPWVANRLAVAAALDGDRSEARSLLDAALAAEAVPELLVNRGALRALAGDMAGAEADLRRALELDPQLAAAWHDLAWVLERRGDAPRAESARVRGATLARRAPRGFPHGVGDGFHLNGQRFMLVLAPAGSGAPLALYRPARARVPPS
jgi:tetratricopeptide (TPR) repeat protein